MNNISLRNHNLCCGCGVCQTVCPTGAITMRIDSDGAYYPSVDSNLCIDCGKCKNKCIFESKVQSYSPQKVFAVAAKNSELLSNVASGGAFSVLATEIIHKGGIVYGAAYVNRNSGLFVQHRRICSIEELGLLQGSKYSQSDILPCFKSVLTDVESGKLVLFSGSPCQVAAIKRYLNRDFDNFISVEIICHGAPGNEQLEKYSGYLAKKLHGKITNIAFRDKTRGWGFNSKITFERNGKKRTLILPGDLNSYYYFFLKWDNLRESCYNCVYANKERCADLTIGDFNGIQVVHPELLKDKGGLFEETKGVSSVLINTKKGNQLFQSIQSEIILVTSDYEHVIKYNQQLIRPCIPGRNRKLVMDCYKDKEWKKMKKCYISLRGYRYYKQLIGELVRHRFK